MEVVIIEQMKTNDPPPRKIHESRWIHDLQTCYPTGIRFDSSVANYLPSSPLLTPDKESNHYLHHILYQLSVITLCCAFTIYLLISIISLFL